MLTLIGVQRKSGQYNGNVYDNIVLHCSNDCPNTSTICGDVVETYKIKVQKVRDVFDGLISSDADWRELLGKKIEVFCDRYGAPQKIIVKEV